MRFRLVPGSTAENVAQGADSWSLQNQAQVEPTAVYKVDAKSTKLVLKLHLLSFSSPPPAIPFAVCPFPRELGENPEKSWKLGGWIKLCEQL